MADEYTYEIPDKEKYLQGVIAILRHNNDNEIAELLKGCKCEITPSSQFSQVRWNCMFTTVHLYVPITKLGAFSQPIKKKLIDACDTMMPRAAGYDVLSVEISPSMDDIPVEQSLAEDLEQISAELSQQILPILPDDIKNKGKEMAEVYLYLYCVENSLRLFIETVAKKHYGDDYFSKLSVPRPVLRGIEIRKKEEQSNQWLRVRGDSDLFYLDFGELGTIIQNNWDLFKDFFSDQAWILGKINEIAKCRHLVAHNSYIGTHEKEVIRVYYHSILKQIGLLK
jgi:hypothetical protein